MYNLNLVENRFEQEPFLALPPKARDIAEEFFTQLSLTQILEKEQHVDIEICHQHHISAELWPDIIAATMVAKCTYILPNPNFSKPEILFLIKLACHYAGYPLNDNSLISIIDQTQITYPVLSDWLKQMTKLFKEMAKTS